jgi:hypothetical protein
MSWTFSLHRVFSIGKPNKKSRRADSNRLPLLQLRVMVQVLHRLAGARKCRISKRLLCSGLPCVGPYCVLGGVRVVSGVPGLRVAVTTPTYSITGCPSIAVVVLTTTKNLLLSPARPHERGQNRGALASVPSLRPVLPEPRFSGADDGLGMVRNQDYGEDVGYVVTHRLQVAEQFASDLLFVASGSGRAEGLAPAVGRLHKDYSGGLCRHRCVTGETQQQPPGDAEAATKRFG